MSNHQYLQLKKFNMTWNIIKDFFKVDMI